MSLPSLSSRKGIFSDGGRLLGYAVLGLFIGVALLAIASAGNVIVKNGQLNVSNDLYAGSTVLYVNSTSGNVGIGTTSPGAKLHVNGTIRTNITSCSQALETDSSGNIICGTDESGGGGMWTNSSGNATFTSGNVGIGTASPDYLLEVYKASSNTTINIAGDSGQQMLVRGEEAGGVSGVFGFNGADNSWGVAMGSNSLYAGNDLTIASNGSVGIGTTAPGVKLSVYSTADASTSIAAFTGSEGTNFIGNGEIDSNRSVLYINSNSGYRNDVDFIYGNVRFKSTGNVGIGTTDPQAKLHVNGTIRTNITSCSQALETDSSGNIICGTDETGGGEGMWTNSSGNATFTSGRVGIGTASPQNKLHIVSGAGTLPSLNGNEYLIIQDNDATSDWPVVSILGGATTGGGSINFADANDDAAGAVGYDHGANEMFFYTNGSTKMLIDNAGNVGIGTTDPTNAQLVIQGAGASYGATVRLTSTGSTPGDFFMAASDGDWTTGGNKLLIGAGTPGSANVKMVMNGSGNVGIGTTDPLGQLHIAGHDVADATNLYMSWGTDNTYKAKIMGVWQDSPTTRLSLGISPTSNDEPGEQLVIIGTTGNVGIGTNAPAGKLEINTSGTSFPSGWNDNLKLTGIYPALWLHDTSSNNGYYLGQDGGKLFFGYESGGTHQFYTTTLDSSGNVGIGTTGPSDKLDVAGYVRAYGFKTPSMTTGAEMVYIRGTGNNNPANRLVRVGNSTLVNTASRGLTLTIITASTHAHVSSNNYDTYGSSAASEGLASALNNMTRSQIGILTSYDAIEDGMTANLTAAAQRLGLSKLAAADNGLRQPYAAIFYGSGTSTGNTEPGRQAVEVLQSADADAPYAIISTWLVEDGFQGQDLNNALVSGDSDAVNPAVYVNQDGYVGIGTTNPQAEFEIALGGSGGNVAFSTPAGQSGMTISNTNRADIRFNDSLLQMVVGLTTGAPASTSGIAIDTSGNVGIGTAAPDALLTVSSNTHSSLPVPTGGTVHIAAADSSPAGILLDSYANESGLGFVRADTTAASPSAIQSSDALGAIAWYGYGSTGYLMSSAAKIEAFAAETWNDSTGAAYLTFNTRPSSTTGASTERMRIDEDGNVGIGTTDPTAKLQIAAAGGGYSSPSTNGLYVYNPTNSSSQDAILAARVAGSGAGDPFVSFDVEWVDGFSMGIDNSDSQKFKIGSDWDTLTDNTRLTIEQGGNVGIGTTTPNAYLNVVGATPETLQSASYNGTDETINNYCEAFKFVASDSFTIAEISVRLKLSTAVSNPSSGFTLHVMTDSGGYPNDEGDWYGWNEWVRYGGLNTSYQEIGYGIDMAVTQGNTYWIVLQRDDTPSGATLYWDTSNGAATGYYAYSSDCDSWTLQNNKRGWFNAYGWTNISVLAESQVSYGVGGWSTVNSGVYGHSVMGPGVEGSSDHGNGLSAYSDYGVAGSFYTPEGLGMWVESGNDNDLMALYDSDADCWLNPETDGLDTSCESDQRLKTNITDTGSVLSEINDFRIRDYNMIKGGERLTGVIAQEVMQTHPEMVEIKDNATGMYAVEQYNLWKVIKAIQEQQAQIGLLQGALNDAGIENSTYNVSADKEFVDTHPGFTEVIRQVLAKMGLTLQDGTASLKQVIVDNLTAKTARVSQLEMVDKATGDIYCTWIENGEWQKSKGACAGS